MTVTHMVKKEPLAALFVGGLIGAGAGLLLAPKSGKKARQQIAGFAGDVKGILQCYASQAGNKVSTAAGKGRNFVVDGKDLIAASIEAGRKAYRREWQRRAKTL